MFDRKPIPRFDSEDEEREFWATHDPVDYIDWSRPRRVPLPNLNPSAIPISIQLPESLLADLEMIASSEEMPCQSLVESLLTERVEQELSNRKDESQ